MYAVVDTRIEGTDSVLVRLSSLTAAESWIERVLIFRDFDGVITGQYSIDEED